jgi:lipopolysaccharide assembly protein A
MQFFYWLAFLVVIGIAIFAVQNSSAPPVIIKFLIWKFETSLVYTILGSILSGILLSLLLWIPKVVRTSFQKGKHPSGTPLGGPP